MKQILLVANAQTAQYNAEDDAYYTGVVAPDNTEVVITDLIVHRPKEEATIYYVLKQERVVDEDELVEATGGEGAPQPE